MVPQTLIVTIGFDELDFVTANITTEAITATTHTIRKTVWNMLEFLMVKEA